MTTAVNETSRNYYRISQAENALRGLRSRIARHVEQEQRLSQLCQDWQNCWSAQHDQLVAQAERLEAHLSTWMPQGESAPELSVVGSHHDEE